MAQNIFIRYILLPIFIIGSLPVVSQNENSKWYFGQYAGVDFSTTPITALNDGQLGTGGLSEGCATISDKTTGDLLFYTNGETVWDASHSPMLGGTGLLGSYTSSQSAIIVPMPGDADKHYIFTTEYQYNQYGLNYSIVDMVGNTGLGEVIQSNIPLINNSTERLTAVAHPNGYGVWVIAQRFNSNEFYAYLVTKHGICDPVITSIGTAYTNINTANGEMKVSPNGEKLAYVSSTLPFPQSGFVELFDFDGLTGKLSNVINITLKYPYGLSFSPDNSKIYVTVLEPPAKLLQFSILSGNKTVIESSRQTVHTDYTPFKRMGAIQMGMDNKLYVTFVGRSKLGVVNNPNGDTSTITFDTIALGTDVQFGLSQPVVIPGNGVWGIDENLNITAGCVEDSVYLEYAASFDSAHWNLGDGNTDYNVNLIGHLYSDSGDYNVSLIIFDGCYTDTIFQQISIGSCDTPQIPLIPVPIDPSDLFIPNTYSPNQDGQNDGFLPLIIGTTVYYSLSIYDRFGNLVFESKNPAEPWNGSQLGFEMLASGYAYYLHIEFDNGEKVVHTGNITLAR